MRGVSPVGASVVACCAPPGAGALAVPSCALHATGGPRLKKPFGRLFAVADAGAGGKRLLFNLAVLASARLALALGKGLRHRCQLVLHCMTMAGFAEVHTRFMLRLCRMLFCQPLLSAFPLSVFSRNHW